MLGNASLYIMHASLESDYAILTFILHFLLCAVAQSGGPWHKIPTLNTSLDVPVLMVTAY